MKFEPKDPNFDERVRSSFARQTAMHTLGVVLERVRPGEVDVTLGELRAFTDEAMSGDGLLVALMNGTMMSVREWRQFILLSSERDPCIHGRRLTCRDVAGDHGNHE